MDTNFSIYSRVNNNTPIRSMTLQQWIDPRNFTGLESAIEHIRSLPTKAEQARFKMKLPAATISGVFSYRSEPNLTKHSGLVSLDFDEVGDDPEGVRDYIYRLPFVIYAGLSAGGRGVWCVVPLAFPERHKLHFEALSDDFKGIGLSLDPSPKNVASARFASIDTTYNVKRSWETYYRLQEPKPTPIHETFTPLAGTSDIQYIYNRLSKAIREAPDGLKRNTLYKTAMAAGGYVAAGALTTQEALTLLENEIRKRNIVSFNEAQKSIMAGIQKGLQTPIKLI